MACYQRLSDNPAVRALRAAEWGYISIGAAHEFDDMFRDRTEATVGLRIEALASLIRQYEAINVDAPLVLYYELEEREIELNTLRAEREQ